MKEFEGKVAIVTGTTGIGRAIAKRFAAGGAKVLACGIEVAANKELALDAKTSGLSLRVEQCDVTQAGCSAGGSGKSRERIWRPGHDRQRRRVSSFWHGGRNRLSKPGTVPDGERRQHLSPGALWSSGDEKARRGSHHQPGVGAGICLPARRRGVCGVQGRGPQPHPRAGAGSCSATIFG